MNKKTLITLEIMHIIKKWISFLEIHERVKAMIYILFQLDDV